MRWEARSCHPQLLGEVGLPWGSGRLPPPFAQADSRKVAVLYHNDPEKYTRSRSVPALGGVGYRHTRFYAWVLCVHRCNAQGPRG